MAQIGTWFSLHENYPNTEFFLVCIFQHSDRLWRDTLISPYLVRIRENREQKKLRIWTLFTQCTVSFANSPFTGNTIDTAIIRSSHLVVFCKTCVLLNFPKFTRKHLRQSLVFNEAADLQSLTLSKKKEKIPTKMLSYQFCKVFRTTIFKEPKKLSIFAKERH